MVKCEVSGVEMPAGRAYNAQFLRQQLFDLIVEDHPDITRKSVLSPEVVNQYRQKYIERLLEKESGEINRLQGEVLESISHNRILSEHTELEFEEQLTFGQQLSDRIANFGGSWIFIIVFFLVIALWMGVNSFIMLKRPFDPYPFILLNLILSCLAAIQAPIIMMSQNRKEDKDRKRAENDYKVNLKAELEIKMLHEKLDHIIVHQHQRLLEIQELQRDYLSDILEKLNRP